MFQIVGPIKDLFALNSVKIEDVLFRLHYFITTPGLLFASLLVTGQVHFGEPIQCSLFSFEAEKVISKDWVNTYCYIHSTYVYPFIDQRTDDFRAYKYPGVGPVDPANASRVFISYYQWVGLVFFLQGISFLGTYLYWRSVDNGLIEGLRLRLHIPAIGTKGVEGDLKRVVDHLKVNNERYESYGRNYLFCVYANLVVAITNVFLTDLFLARTFITYGIRFTYAYNGGVTYQDLVFPKMSKCDIHSFGASGSEQRMDAMCVLPLNILLDKIFLVFWYWYFILVLASLVAVFHWSRCFCDQTYRLRHLERHVGGTIKVKKYPGVLNNTFGSWFVLHQVYRNIGRTNFIRLVSELSKVDHVTRAHETCVDFGKSDYGIDQAEEVSFQVGDDVMNN